jgi:hypothetical protein
MSIMSAEFGGISDLRRGKIQFRLNRANTRFAHHLGTFTSASLAISALRYNSICSHMLDSAVRSRYVTHAVMSVIQWC